MATPIKRHPSLIQVSREHHFGLLLSWKIREGLKRNVDPKRIKEYTDWFYNNYQKKHFKIEEKYMYPVLGNNHPLVIQALQEHRSMDALFQEEDHIEDALKALEKAMESHIRFEERVLFNTIQETASDVQLQLIEANHNEPFADNWIDEFWKDPKS